jgi:hypothetical protein
VIVGSSEAVNEIEGVERILEWGATQRPRRTGIRRLTATSSTAARGIETMSEKSRAGGPIGMGVLSGCLSGSGSVGGEVNDGRAIESIEIERVS